MLAELDRCCNRKAFAASANLPAGSAIFVNITPASLLHPEFNAHEFAAMVRAAGLLPQLIVVDVARVGESNPALLIARALDGVSLKVVPPKSGLAVAP